MAKDLMTPAADSLGSHETRLSPMEVAAVLHGAVERFEGLGIGREHGLSGAQVESALARVAPVLTAERA